MSPFDRASRLLFILAPLLVLFACGTGDGRCLRESDCDDGYVCTQGTCRAGDRVADEAPMTSSSTPDATTSASPIAHLSDASSDVIDASSLDAGDASDASDAAASDQ